MNEANEAIKIVLADDHELLRDGFKALLKKIPGVRLLAEAANGKELCEAVKNHDPDVVITDIKMPVMDGVEAVKAIRKNHPSVKIIALSNYHEENLIIEMINAGAEGYLIKNAEKREMIDAIRAVYNGKIFYCTNTSQILLTYLNDSKVGSGKKQQEISFTKRELEVMQLICKGITNKEIGSQLGISARTVENHRQSMQEKIGVKSAVGIALFAAKHGYI